MTANKKIGVLCITASAAVSLVGCATDETSAPELEPGHFAVAGVELSSCAEPDAWVATSTPMTSIVIAENALGDGYVVNTCVDSACAPGTPSQYALRDDAWMAEYGGAFLVDTGCFLLHVDATARLEGGNLVIETTRWSNQVTSGRCTLTEVSAMFARPCDERNRIVAVQLAH